MREKKLVKEAVICSECGEELEPKQYLEKFTCDFCDADFYDKDATPLGVLRTLYIDQSSDIPRGVKELHFDKPECIAGYMNKFIHPSDTIQLPWLSPFQWELFSSALIQGENLVTDLLKIVDDQLIHQDKQEPSHYQRGYVQGVKWSETEIKKVFKR